MAGDWQSSAAFSASADACLLRSREGFLCAPQGLLFHPQQLPAGLCVLAQQKLGFFKRQAVSLLLCSGALPKGCSWQNLRSLMQQADGAALPMLCVAEQIAHWHEQHQFCGRCGAKTAQLEGERCMRCPSCGLESYPRLSPSMIVLVTRGDEILLARSPRFVAGVYSTLAGFVEPGETLEQCVQREVYEEVALHIRNLRYQGSQSWPFPHSLMLGFHAEYASGAIKRQETEIEDAQWFSIHQLPRLPMPQSIARQLIESYRKQRLARTA